MSTAETPAVPRPRLPPPGGGRILTRRGLARMLAQLQAAATPQVQAEGAAAATGNSLTWPPPGETRTAQTELDLRAQQMQALIPGRGRVITKAAFGAALRAFVAGLGFRLDVDGADRMLEDADGGISLRLPRRAYNVYIFIQIEIFDNVSGDTLRDIALAGTYTPADEILTTTAEWEFTQMLELPEADPPRSRTISVTYWARYRSPTATGTPDYDDADLVWLGPVQLTLKKYNRTTGTIDSTPTVLIDDPDGVTDSYSTTAARSGDELVATALEIL